MKKLSLVESILLKKEIELKIKNLEDNWPIAGKCPPSAFVKIKKERLAILKRADKYNAKIRTLQKAIDESIDKI